ncbi:hypothetical protein MHK_010972 [Candidatus Magnetomorum sp. HK-1]|nr:hypothetical protein MHK_010972 [Candidatus Magnetomorum sp. HK-1]
MVYEQIHLRSFQGGQQWGQTLNCELEKSDSLINYVDFPLIHNSRFDPIAPQAVSDNIFEKVFRGINQDEIDGFDPKTPFNS